MLPSLISAFPIARLEAMAVINYHTFETLTKISPIFRSSALCRLLDYVDCFVRHGIGALRNLGYLRLM